MSTDPPGASNTDPQNPPTVLLIDRCKAGDRAALDDLARRFYPPVYRMVRARLGPGLLRKEGVEDLVQETFLRVLEGLHTFEARPDAHFTAYLARVAYGAVANRAEYHGAMKRDAGREVPIEGMRAAAEDSSFGFQLASPTTTPASKAAKTELEEIVDECVGRLDEAQREVILLRDYAGADWPFIASELERPSVPAAQQLHHRARAKLSEAVKLRL